MSIMNSVISAQSGGGGGVPTCTIWIHPPTPNEPFAAIKELYFIVYENDVVKVKNSRSLGSDDRLYNVVCGSLLYVYITGMGSSSEVIIPDSMEKLYNPLQTKVDFYLKMPTAPGTYEIIYYRS